MKVRWRWTLVTAVVVGWAFDAHAASVPSTVSYCGAPTAAAWEIAFYNAWEAAYGKVACGFDQLGFVETPTAVELVSLPCSAECGCGHVLPVVCNKTWTCPANSSLDPADSTQCTCAPTYVAAGGQCGCPANATDAGGACVCNDGYAMQNGSCVALCQDPNSHWDGAACVCNAPYVMRGGVCSPPCSDQICGTCAPDVINASTDASRVDFNATVRCPGGAGDLGISFMKAASSTIAPASCGSGCVARGDSVTSASVTLAMCKTSDSLSFEMQDHDTTTYATTCETNACKTICDVSRACRHAQGSVTAGGSRTWNYPLGSGDRFNGAGFQVRASCRASAGITLSVTGSYDTTENDGYPGACTSCTNVALDASVGGTGRGGCSLSFSLGDPATLDAVQRYVPRQLIPSFSAECTDCLTLDVTGTAGVSGRWGDCGARACVNGSVTATGAIQTPSYCSTLFGRSVSTRVRGSLTGQCTASGCSSDSSATCDYGGQLDVSVAGRCRNLTGP